MIQAKIGEFAYLDCFTGRVPCKTLALETRDLWPGGPSLRQITVRLTASRGAYTRGEEIEESALHVLPRTAVYRSRQACGAYRIQPYCWSDK